MLLFVNAIAASCATLDAGGVIGLDSERASEGGRAIGMLVGGSFGTDLTDCLGLPLRSEASLTVSSLGPPWGQGGKLVSVARTQIDLTATVGVSQLVYGRLGAEALAGGAVRATRVAIEAVGDTRASTLLSLHPALLAGVFVATEGLRLAVRATMADLADPRLGLLVAVHWLL